MIISLIFKIKFVPMESNLPGTCIFKVVKGLKQIEV